MRGLERKMNWARMKPGRSRSLVIKQGLVTDRYRFTVVGTNIPTLLEKPIKNLGKTFGNSLRDAASICQTTDDLDTALSRIDKSGLLG